MKDPTVSIIIPSFRRAHPDRLPGRDYFRSAKYCVPESQAAEYVNVVGASRVLAIPDSADGNIARKRNWILRNIPRPLLMIDDDVSGLCHTEGVYKRGRWTGKSNQKIMLTPEEADDLIVRGFNLAHQFGCVLWGLNLNEDGRIYKQFKPFSLSAPVLRPFTGHLAHRYLNDERMGSKDDYDFALQVLNKERKILRLNKFAYVCEHGDNAGGIVSSRTIESETKFCRAIERKWGRHIIQYSLQPKRMADLLNARVAVPIGNV